MSGPDVSPECPAPPEPSRKTPLTANAKLAIASLVCGIVSVAYPACITGPICSVAAFVTGILGIKSEKRGSAILGIVFGCLGSAAFALLTHLEYQTRETLNDVLSNAHAEKAVDSIPSKRPPDKVDFDRWLESINLTETYVNKQYGFAIDFPAKWQQKYSPQRNTIIKAVHKDDQSRIALIAVAVYPMDAEGDIWNVSGEQMFGGFKNEYPGADCVLLESGKTLIGGEHAVWTLIDVRSPPVVSMLTRSYHFVRKPLLYRISTSTDRDQAWFAQHSRTFQESVASFRFLNSRNRAGPGGNIERKQ